MGIVAAKHRRKDSTTSEGETDKTPLLSSSKDEPEKNKNSDAQLGTCPKIAKTILWVSVWICLGAFTEIVGPVLPELVAQTHSNTESIAQATAMRGAGLIVGSITGLWLIERLFRHLYGLAALILTLYVSVCVSSAYVTNITTLYIVYMLQGGLEGWIQTATVRALLKVWEQKSSASMFSFHIAFAIGKTAVPKIVGPFLDGAHSTTHNATDMDVLDMTKSKTGVTAYPSNFVKGYWILAGMSSPVILTLLASYCLNINSETEQDIPTDTATGTVQPVVKSIKDHFDPKSCSPSKPILGILLVVLCTLYYGLATSFARVVPKFLFSYARNGPQLTVDKSTWLQSELFFGMIIGRVIALLLSIVLPSSYIMLVSSVGFMISALVLFLFHMNLSVLWATLPIAGFFSGPIIPAAFATLHNYIELTTVAIILSTTGGAIGDITVMYGLGSDFAHKGPYVLWTYTTCLAAGQLFISLLVLIVAYIHGVRYKQMAK